MRSISKRLIGTGKQLLNVQGVAEVILENKNEKAEHEVYVVKNQEETLLAMPAIKAMK